MSNQETPPAPEPYDRNAFDEYISRPIMKWRDHFESASIHVCEGLKLAKKMLQQVSGNSCIKIPHIIEVTRLILLENQRLNNNERKRRDASSE